MKGVRLTKCRVCKKAECETFAKLYLDPPPSCGHCGLAMMSAYLSGPFFGGHEGEIITWSCYECDEAEEKIRTPEDEEIR